MEILGDTADLLKHMDTDDVCTVNMFVIMKKKPTHIPANSAGGESKYKDGFHILIPEFWAPKGYKKYLCNEIIASKKLAKVFRPDRVIGDPNDALDKNSVFVPVHFFGCSKPGHVAYDLAYQVVCTINDADDININVVNGSVFEAANDTYNLAYELSLGFYREMIGDNPTLLKKQLLPIKNHILTQVQLLGEKIANENLSEDDILQVENSVDIMTLGNAEAAYLRDLLGLLDISYASTYAGWFQVMCIIAHTSVHYKPIAMWFSHRRPDSFSAAEFERVWDEATSRKFDKTPITIGTLIHWVKASSPMAFQEINEISYTRELARACFENEGRITNWNAAKILHRMIGDKFVADVGYFDETKGFHWFEFVTPGQAMKRGEVFKWRHESTPSSIHRFMGDHMPKIYKKLEENIKERKEKAENEGLSKYWKNVLDTFKRSRMDLGSASFQNQTITLAKNEFKKHGFIDELDSYPDVMGVGNGVLLLGAKPKLITGFHEYKITKFTGTNYRPYNPENQHIKRLESAMRDSYPEEDVFRFIMMYFSTAVEARPTAYLLLMIVGDGSNGKSTPATLTQYALGHAFASSGVPSLLTSAHEKANEANSALMQIEGKRFFYFDEFNNGDILNPARVKTLVSPGFICGRELFRGQSNFVSWCNLMLFSNFVLKLMTTDHGTWRRIYYYQSKTKYVDKPNPENPLEKLIDRTLEDCKHDPAYLEAWLSILVHWNQCLHSEYGGDLHAIPVPTIVKETEDFRNKNDFVNKFLTQMVVISPKADQFGITVLAEAYNKWFRAETCRDNKSSITDTISQLMSSRVKKYVVELPSDIKFVSGCRIKMSMEESLDEGESHFGTSK